MLKKLQLLKLDTICLLIAVRIFKNLPCRLLHPTSIESWRVKRFISFISVGVLKSGGKFKSMLEAF